MMRRALAFAALAPAGVVGATVALSPLVAVVTTAGAMLLVGLVTVSAGPAVVAALSPAVLLVPGSLGSAVLVGLATAWTLRTLATGRRPARPVTPVAFTVLAGYWVLSWLVGYMLRSPATDFLIEASTVALIALPLLLLWVRPIHPRYAHRLVDVAAWSTTLVASYGLLLYPVSPYGAEALLASERHNLLGTLFVIGLLVHLSRVHRDTPRGAFVLRMAAMGILLSAIVLSLSREAWFALVCSVGAYFFLNRSRALIPALVGVLLALGLLVLLPAQAFVLIGDRAATVPGFGALDLSSTVRLDLWSAATAMVADNPILGVGLLRFPTALPTYWSGTASQLGILTVGEGYQYAHNTFLTMAAQGGIIGLGLLVRAGTLLVRDVLSVRGPAKQQALLILIATAAGAMFGEAVFSPAIAIPVLLVLVAARSELLE